jgi:3',5'-cyclic AMP phosphodiesterase CpdA
VRSAAVLLAAVAVFVPAAGHAQDAKPVRIVAIGDFGVGGETQLRLGAAVGRFERRNGTDLLLTLGDNDYTESPSAFRANWEASFGWARRRGLRVAGVLGNHDVRVDNGRYEFSTLQMPGRYYRRKVGDVELFVLDSNQVDAAQTSWLRRRLALSTAGWKLAAFHHPAYTCGSYRSDERVVQRWVPLFERYRVRLVLSGHDHNYQRFAPWNRVRYLVHGAGSTRSYALAECPAGYPRRVRASREQGFLYLVVRGTRLDGWAVRVDGRRLDHFAVRAGG